LFHRRAIAAETVFKEVAPFVGKTSFPDCCFGTEEDFLGGALLAGCGRGGD
jgi:hypothetical protein